MEQLTGSKLEKQYVKAVCRLLPFSFNICRVHYVKCQAEWIASWNQDYQKYLFFCLFVLILFYLTLQYCIGVAIYQNESATGINLRYADDTTLMVESKEELKSLLIKMKEESEKVGLKLNIQKMNMAFGPITSWEIDGETVETVSVFIFLGSKITVDGDCSHEIKRRLLLGRKAMTNLDSILKSRDITLPTMVHLVKAMVFPVVMYGYESWTVKKAERRRIDAFFFFF